MAMDPNLEIIDRNDKSYPNILVKRPGKDAPERLWVIGRPDLINIPKDWKPVIEEGRLLVLSPFPAAKRLMETPDPVI